MATDCFLFVQSLVSGGVDSAVCTALICKALGYDKVTAVHIDNGFMRKNESSQVLTSLQELGINLQGKIHVHPSILSFIYLFTHSFIYLFTHLFIYLFTPSFIYLFTHLFIYSLIHLSIYSLIYLSIYSLIHLSIYSLIYLSIHSFIYPSIHSFIYQSIYPFTHPSIPSVINAALTFSNSTTTMNYYDHEGQVHRQLTPYLHMVTNAEEKRHIIGDTFMKIAKEILQDLSCKGHCVYLAQGRYGIHLPLIIGIGTLRPDLIESASALVSTNAHIIKTHHNDTQLVREMRSKGFLVEPLTDFHKDEVRQLGISLGNLN